MFKTKNNTGHFGVQTTTPTLCQLILTCLETRTPSSHFIDKK